MQWLARRYEAANGSKQKAQQARQGCAAGAGSPARPAPHRGEPPQGQERGEHPLARRISSLLSVHAMSWRKRANAFAETTNAA